MASLPSQHLTRAWTGHCLFCRMTNAHYSGQGKGQGSPQIHFLITISLIFARLLGGARPMTTDLVGSKGGRGVVSEGGVLEVCSCGCSVL